MSAKIEQMERQKAELEAQNARTIDENRTLLDQLEDLNGATLDSDSTIQSLTGALESTQEELRRVSILASRAETLERQLSHLEKDQAQIQGTLVTTATEERTAIQRWRNAEKTISLLQDQIEQIEKEAREERERHAEVISRTEGRIAVESALDTTVRKVRGTAAAKGTETGENRIVSNFVRDILQDNANLQVGIVELRDMLTNSNEEVERLREQFIAHQPVEIDTISSPTLERELGDHEPVGPREVHVHHHYHAAPEASPRLKVPVQRRGKKRRSLGQEGQHSARSSISRIAPIAPTSTTAILSQTSVTIPHQRPPRWSLQSTAGVSIASSLPSSPYAHSRRTSSVFDRVFSDVPMDSSRPTSPESNAAGSPLLTSIDDSNWQRPLGVIRSMETLNTGDEPGMSTPTKARPSQEITAASPVAGHFAPDASALSPRSFSAFPPEMTIFEEGSETTPQPTNSDSADIFAPRLRRAASHDSILSLALDSDSLQPTRGRPTHQPSLFPSHSPNTPTFYSTPTIATPSSAIPSRPIFTAATTLRTSLSRSDLTSSSLTRSLLRATSPHPSIPSAPNLSPTRRSISTTRKLGGWVWGNWGVAPTPSMISTHPVDRGVPSQQPSSQSGGSGSLKERKPRPRLPGVNQAGWILGFQPEPPVAFNVEPERVDSEALGEALGGAAEGTRRM
ncbi:hypothetical protein P152DRAFT_458575 [Eremomyces bilateralis CBS 781.70]|uniref:Uncharacterized protein n=1 Tax=Eremomyces bilateralis CBS 781.70 TaxID=1392243 RepID=A0A6G1G2M3_9PEZI|nr:uncharacterized protein P152DRAFT_458575 [Eremomyces bilateralis CBS 781.70]KAF1812170.1 hypothetical protein P152DRAFT_458575 [Eremomyces bilateralis CBS 781.70]